MVAAKLIKNYVYIYIYIYIVIIIIIIIIIVYMYKCCKEWDFMGIMGIEGFLVGPSGHAG